MKKVLQKSLRRLHALLLLAVMFVVGGSAAWAEDQTVTFQYKDFVHSDNETIDGVSVVLSGFSSYMGDDAGYYGSGTISIQSETEIKSIQFTNDSYSYGSYYEHLMTVINGSLTSGHGTSTATITPTAGATEVTITLNNSTNIRYLYVTVAPEEVPTSNIEYTVNINSEIPAGGSVSLDGQNFTQSGNYSVMKNLKLSDLEVVVPANYYVQKSYDKNNHIFDVAFRHYYYYTIVVRGSEDYSAYVSYNGRSYYNGNRIESETRIEDNEFMINDINGCDETISVTGSGYEYTVNAEYTESAEIPYYVIFVGEGCDVPSGASATVNDVVYTENATFNSKYVLRRNTITNVNEPDGYYAEYDYDEETKTFTITYKEYIYYSIIVEGTTDETAGVIYNNNTYGVDDRIEVKYALTESAVQATPVAWYEGVVSLTGTNTFTVRYTKLDYLAVDFTKNASINAGGITISTTASSSSNYQGSGLNVYDGRTITVTSEKALEKIVFDGLAPYSWGGGHALEINSGGGSWLNNNSSESPATWVAGTDAHSVVFTNASGSDMWVHDVKIYVVELANYSVSFVDAPAGATISVDGVSGTFVNGGHFEAAKGLTPEKVHGNCPGYDAEVTVEGNAVTVTFVKINYVEFVTSGISNTSVGEYKATNNGVTITGFAESYVKMLELFSTNRLVVESAVQPIERIVITRADEPTLAAVSNPVGLNGNEWSDGGAGNVQYVSFTANTGVVNYISKVRVYFPQPVEYTLVFAGEVPAEATVTIDGEQYAAGQFEGRKTLTTGDIDYTWPGYDADVTYNEETSTFTVTYHATTTYDVVVDPEGLEGAAVIYGEDEYAAGTGVITCRGTIDKEALSAKGVYGYVGEVSVSGTTITVTYTVSEYYDVAESDITVIEGDMAGLTKFKIAAPAGTTFSEILAADPQGKNVTVNGKAENSTIALGYENSFITFTNPVMANQYGTFTVEFAAGLFQTADGKKNNAFSYNFENVDPATIVNNYYVTLWGYQYPELAPDGANVTIGGHDGEITTADAYTLLGFHDQIPEFGTATTTLEGYDVEAVISGNQINVYFHKLAAVSSYTPANEANCLDDDAYEYGYNSLVLTFAAPFKEAVNIASGDELPAGMSLTLPTGVTRGSVWANSGSSELHIGLNGGNVAGDYSVEIAKNLFSFSYAQAVDGTITNDAFSQTWKLNAATTFRVNSYAIATEDVEGNEFTATQHNLNKFQAFAVSAPAEQVFSAVTNPVTVDVTVGDADPVQVAATAALEEEGAKAVFTLPAAYTEEGDVSVNVPAGVLTLGGLTSKAFEFDVTIQPYDYFSISAEPAPETTYTGDRNTIVITLPVGKTADTVGSTISLNGNPETVTAYAIDGNTVTLTLENGFQYGSNYYNIPAGFLTDTNGDKNNYFGSWSVNVVKQMMYASAYVNGETTENTVTVEKFSSVRIYFDERMSQYYNLNDIPTITFTDGVAPISCSGWANWNDDSFFFSFNEISAPGTYTIHIPAGVFTSTEGNQNEEVDFNIEILEPEYFAAMTVSPADGETRESLSTITLTAPDGVTFDDVKGIQGRVTVNEDPYNYPSSVVFANDKKSVTFNISEQTEDGNYTVTFPAGFVRSTDGKWSPKLTATYTVSYPWFTLRSNNVTPATGEVAAIENITIAAPAGIEFATPEENVTIVVNGVETQVGASLNDESKIVLAYSATKADRYEISIPAETFTASDGFKKNKELTGLTYTIQPSLAINEHSMDDKGDTWTTFCLNKDFTLEDGYTPYIVRDNGEGGIKLVELLGTPIVDTYNCYFDSAYGDATEHTDHNGAINSSNIAGKYQVTYESNQTYNDGGYYDITYGYKNLVFTIKVLDGAQAPSNAGALYYNPTLGTEVSTTFNQISDDTFTVTVESGHWASHVGGLYIEVATGTYNTPVIPANTGILVKGAAKSGIQYTQAGGTKADVSGNLLWGCTQSQLKEVGNDQYIYKLAWASSDYDDFGFYWGSEDGHSIQANAGKAYLILDADQSSYSNRMLIFGGQDQILTAIDTVEGAEIEVPVFNLQGKRMSNPEHLPAGVYVKNGRKFIVK